MRGQGARRRGDLERARGGRALQEKLGHEMAEKLDAERSLTHRRAQNGRRP